MASIGEVYAELNPYLELGTYNMIEELQEHERPIQISELIYEIPKTRLKPWSAEILFFHGLNLERTNEPHITTWLSRDKKDFWPNCLQKEYPNARILTVGYHESGLKRTNMYTTLENLLAELISRQVSVGKAGCPIILVAHSRGRLVLKRLLLMAAQILNHTDSPVQKGLLGRFLLNVKAIMWYGSPEYGSQLPSWDFERTLPPIGDIAKLASRRNSEFQHLRSTYKWRSIEVGESRPVTLNRFTGLTIPEASSRRDVDIIYTANADHFTVGRPENTTSPAFTLLAELIEECIYDSEFADLIQGVQPELPLRTQTRIAIVGRGGVGKTTFASAVYKKIAKEYQYSCFFQHVSLYMTESDGVTPESLRERIKARLVDRSGRSVSASFQWSELHEKTVLIVLDNVESKAQVEVMTEGDEFSPGSRVIITARDKSFIMEANLGFYIYELKELNDDDSMKLFCLHAFRQQEPPLDIGFRDLYLKDMVRKCEGVPSVLIALGKYLFGREEAMWMDAFKILSNSDGSIVPGTVPRHDETDELRLREIISWRTLQRSVEDSRAGHRASAGLPSVYIDLRSSVEVAELVKDSGSDLSSIPENLRNCSWRKIKDIFVSDILIAEGSDGTMVFEGYLGGQHVAVKCLWAKHSEKVRKEVNSFIKLRQHPNVVTYHSTAQDQQHFYIALERCSCNLYDLIQDQIGKDQNAETREHLLNLWDGKRPSVLLVQIMRDIVNGLIHLHSEGIVHRDLKPHNILHNNTSPSAGLPTAIQTKIADMGLSKELENYDRSFENKSGLGSTGWQAPEQLRTKEELQITKQRQTTEQWQITEQLQITKG